MLECRPIYRVIIALIVCISIWQIALQEAQFVPAEYSLPQPIYALQPPPSSLSIDNNGNNVSYTYPPAIAMDQLNPEDIHRLIDLVNFDYLIPQPMCPILTPTTPESNYTNGFSAESTRNAPTHTIIIVNTAPKNWNKRNVIRETWGSEYPHVRLIFLLGAVESKRLQHKLEQENYLFGDLLQGNFIDAYRNMTYKHVMGLKWFVYNCPEAKYLLKTDDDVFVNTPNLYEFLQDPNISSTIRRDLLFCYRKENAPIKRSYRNKWRVTTKEYAGHYYPPYCPGYSIVYSADVVFVLYREAQRTTYFWIDDVHVTGTLATAANVTIRDMGTSHLTWPYLWQFLQGDYNNNNNNNNNIEKSSSAYKYFIFTEPNLTEETIRALWRQVVSTTTKDRLPSS